MCSNGHVKINFRHPFKLLQEIFLKIKLRKFLQKCSTLEKIVFSTPELSQNLWHLDQIKKVTENYWSLFHGFLPPCSCRWDLIESNQNVMVESKFQSYIWGEVNVGWGHVKVLLERRNGICLCKLIFEVLKVTSAAKR